jgi:uncharacterized protein (DUF2345 family)/LysM repeat protein
MPDNRYMSGVVSKEIDSDRTNQLKFDDTKGQISAQLQSDDAQSQLNLGTLTHPRKGTAEKRGEGAELRTDASAAIRAAKGLYLSTHGQKDAKGDQMDTAEVKENLNQSAEQMTAQSDFASKMNANKLNAINTLVDCGAALLQGKGDGETVANFTKAFLVIASPDDIALSTAANLHEHAAGNKTQSSGGDTNIGVGGDLTAVVSKFMSLMITEGIKLFSAKGKIEVQAQNNAIEVISRSLLHLISTEDAVRISAQRLDINVAGCRLLIENGHVTITMPGEFTVKTMQFTLGGPMRAKANLPTLPIVDASEDVLPIELVSTYAHDQLVELAKTFSPEAFAAILVSIFGRDIPDSVYYKLQQDLQAGSVASPKHVVTAGTVNGHAAGFNHEDKTIHLAAGLVSKAEFEAYREKLFIAMLEEYGHYIDDLLRNSGKYPLSDSFNTYTIRKDDTLSKLAKKYGTTVEVLAHLNNIADPNVIYIGDLIKIPVKAKKLASDAKNDEGSIYAYHLAQLTEGKQRSGNIVFVFGTVKGPKFSGELKMSVTSGKKAAQMYADFVAQMDDAKDVTYEYFGAGEGKFERDDSILAARGKIDPRTGKYIKADDNKGKRIEHGHQSIEKEAIGEDSPRPVFDNKTVAAIYAGNWLRDHSQLVAPAVLDVDLDVGYLLATTATAGNPVAGNSVKGVVKFQPSRQLISRLLAILAYKHFFDEDVAKDLLALKLKEVGTDPAARYRRHMRRLLAKTPYKQMSEKTQDIYKALALKAYKTDASLPHRLFRDLWLPDGVNVVGVYRYEEHVDNPFGTTDARKARNDPRYNEYKDFNPAATDKTHKTNSDTKSAQYNLKNYIADNTPNVVTDSPFPTALECMIDNLKKSMLKNSNSDIPLRHLGTAFHILEDFFAHSNFVEVALIKNGYTAIRHEVVRKYDFKDYTQIPIVTGTFGKLDTLASLSSAMASLIGDPLQSLTEYEGMVSGERRLEELLIQAIIEEVNNKQLSSIWNSYLSLRDALCELYEDGYIDKQRKVLKLAIEIERALISVNKQAELVKIVFKPLRNLLAKWVGYKSLKAIHGEIESLQNANPYLPGDNPTHTQLAKDEHDSPLHLLAAQLAIIAVRDVGIAWARWYNQPTAINQQAVIECATGYFRHPSRCNWMDAEVKTWARQNPKQIKAANNSIGDKAWDSTRRAASNTKDGVVQGVDAAGNAINSGMKQAEQGIDRAGKAVNNASKAVGDFLKGK